MSWRRRTSRVCALVAGLGAATLGWLYLPFSLPAGAQAPSSLQVFSTLGSASSIGIVSRVPAETDGGVAFSSTALDLNKARATAAGVTVGPLGEAFLITTVPGYTNPALAVAEYPATSAFKSEVTTLGSTTTPSGLPLSGRAAHFHAIASSQPSADATAAPAIAEMTGLISIGAGTSSSHSEVTADGTVITEVHASVSSVKIAGLVSLEGLTSSAKVVVPLGGTPQSSLTVGIAGATVAGVPVELTSEGLQVAHQVALPVSALAAVNNALGMLSAQGITIVAVPTIKTSDAGTATVSGAALEIHYVVPTAVSLPTDIGKDEDIQLAQLSASALGRARHPLTLPPQDFGSTGGPALSGPALGGAVSTGAPASSGIVPTGGPSAASALPPPLTPSASDGSPFRLPTRRRGLTAEERLRTTYGIIILVAFAGAGALVTRSRTRLTY